MDTTRASLLVRIRDPRDTQAWSEFYDLYAPLIYQYARARGLSHDAAEEVRSACYVALVRQMPHFRYDMQKGGFKAWLRTLVQRRVIDLLRKKRPVVADSRELAELPDEAPDLDELWERHWKQQHLRYCMGLASQHVSDETYLAFRMLVEEGASVPEVCECLEWTPNQVYKAKGKVLKAVKELMAEWMSQ